MVRPLDPIPSQPHLRTVFVVLTRLFGQQMAFRAPATPATPATLVGAPWYDRAPKWPIEGP